MGPAITPYPQFLSLIIGKLHLAPYSLFHFH